MTAMTVISTTGAFFQEQVARSVVDSVGAGRTLLVGGGSKGPVNKAVRIGSMSDLIAKFGGPLTTDEGVHSAIKYLDKTNQLFYYRVAGSAAKAASVPVPGITGGSSAVAATGSITFDDEALPEDGDKVTISDGTTSVVFELDDDNTVTGSNVAVAIEPDTGLSTADRVLNTVMNLLSAINNRAAQTTPSTFKVTGALAGGGLVINLTNGVPGTAGNVTITKTGDTITVAGMADGAAAVAGATSAVVLSFVAKELGTYGNYIRVTTQASTVVGAPAGRFDVIVYGPDPANLTGPLQRLELFRNMNLDPNSPRYVATIMGQEVSIENPPSALLDVEVIVSGAAVTVTAGTYTLGTNGGDVGNNGLPLTSTDIIGTVNGQVATGLKNLRNPEPLHFDYITVPGNTHKDVIAELISLATYRGTCQALIDIPFGLSRDGAMNWHNGLDNTTPNAPTAQLDSPFLVISGPWVEDFDNVGGKWRWYPLSAKVASSASLADANYGANFAPNGHLRGRIAGRRSEWIVGPEDRSVWNGENGCINPVSFFETDGLVYYGNMTACRDPLNPLRFWSIRKAVTEAQFLCVMAIRVLVFDPNDEAMWRSFENLCETPLAAIIQKRGLKDAKIICNADTNTQSLQRQGKAYGRILITPVYPANQIVIGFSLTDSIAEFENVQITP